MSGVSIIAFKLEFKILRESCGSRYFELTLVWFGVRRGSASVVFVDQLIGGFFT